MSKVISHTALTDTLSITECVDGFWLYDKTRDMNLLLRAKTPTDEFVGALVEAISYYQNRLTAIESDNKMLVSKISTFFDQFKGDDRFDDCDDCDQYQ